MASASTGSSTAGRKGDDMIDTTTMGQMARSPAILHCVHIVEPPVAYLDISPTITRYAAAGSAAASPEAIQLSDSD